MRDDTRGGAVIISHTETLSPAELTRRKQALNRLAQKLLFPREHHAENTH